MMWRRIRNVVFITGTILLVVLEFVQGLDGDPGTRPWTFYLIKLPMWAVIVVPIVGGIVLALHLWWEKRQRLRQLRRLEKTLLRTGQDPPCP